MSNTKPFMNHEHSEKVNTPWMTDEEVRKLWDRTSTVNVQKLGCDIRNAASEHFDPIVADLKAEVERLKGETQEIYDKAANESIMAHMDKDALNAKITRLKASNESDAVGFAEWVADNYERYPNVDKTTSELYQEYKKQKG